MVSTRRTTRLAPSVGVALLAITTVLVTSCIKEYELERPDHDRGTLGEELHRIWLKDTERSPTDSEERTELLEDNEDRFVEAVDEAVPAGKVHELDQFLKDAVWIIEEGYVPATSRRLGILLEEAADDQRLMSTLENRPPYRVSEYIAPDHRGRAIAHAVDYQQLPELLGHLGEVLRSQDGYDDGRQIGPSAYADLLRSLTDVVADDPATEGSDRLASALRDVLFSPDNRYRIGDDAPRGHHVALFDDRGLPLVRLDDGEVPAPFVDSDGDGLADVDDQGRFILDDGARLELPPMGIEEIDHPDLHRSVFGRVNRGPSLPAFQYVDVGDTAGPYLIQLWADLIQEDVFYDMSRLHRDLFGPTEALEDDRGIYQGYSREHPLVDIVDALLSGMDYQGIPQSLAMTSDFVRYNIDDLAFIAYTFGDVASFLVDYPDADIFSNQTLLHDALEVLREIAENPELWADVMEALRDPVVERTGEALSTLVNYRDHQVVPIEYRLDSPDGATGDYDSCFYDCDDDYEIGTVERFDCIRACPSDELFSDETRFDQPESKTNRSVFQRLFHLLRDTTGVEYVLEIEQLDEPWLGLDAEDLPPIMTLPGAAEAFLRTVAGEMHIKDFISQDFEDSGLGELLQMLMGDSSHDSVAVILSAASEMFGFHLDTEPTPDQITRLFNQPNLEADFEDDDVYLGVRDPECKDGFVMANHHADGLFAAEASGLIDTIQPLAEAFAGHDREDLLAELFVIVHDHYSGYDDLYLDANGNPSPMKASNLVSVEPPLQDVFDDGQIFQALRKLALATEGMADDDGVSGDERIRQLIYQLIRDDDGYQARYEPRSLQLGDGRVLDAPSRLQIILDRLDQMVERHEGDDELHQELASVGERLMEVTLAPRKVDDDEYEFGDDRILVLAADILDHLGERADEMERRGELGPWLTETVPDGFADFYSSRGFFAANELLWEAQREPAGREKLDGLVTYFADDPTRSDHLAMWFYGLVVAGYDLEAYMPVGQIVLEGLDPDREFDVGPHKQMTNATLLAIMLEKTPDVDQHGYGLDVIQRGAQGTVSREPSWPVLIDILTRYFSHQPNSDQPLDAQSWQAVLQRIGHWLHDDLHGLERYYELVEFRGNLEMEDL